MWCKHVSTWVEYWVEDQSVLDIRKSNEKLRSLVIKTTPAREIPTKSSVTKWKIMMTGRSGHLEEVVLMVYHREVSAVVTVRSLEIHMADGSLTVSSSLQISRPQMGSVSDTCQQIMECVVNQTKHLKSMFNDFVSDQQGNTG